MARAVSDGIDRARTIHHRPTSIHQPPVFYHLALAIHNPPHLPGQVEKATKTAEAKLAQRDRVRARSSQHNLQAWVHDDKSPTDTRITRYTRRPATPLAPRPVAPSTRRPNSTGYRTNFWVHSLPSPTRTPRANTGRTLTATASVR